jgi:hypothetical protein
MGLYKNDVRTVVFRSVFTVRNFILYPSGAQVYYFDDAISRVYDWSTFAGDFYGGQSCSF